MKALTGCQVNVRIGDVFKAKATGPAGWHGGTRYWVVVGLSKSDTRVHMLGLREDGTIASTTSYGIHALARREKLARIKCVALFAKQLKGEAP